MNSDEDMISKDNCDAKEALSFAATSDENRGETRPKVLRISPRKGRYNMLHLSSLEDEMRFTFDFICSRSGAELQYLLTKARRSTSGTKEVLRSRIMLHFLCEVERSVFPVSQLKVWNEKAVDTYLLAKKNMTLSPVPSPKDLLKRLTSSRERKEFREELPFQFEEDISDDIPLERRHSTERGSSSVVKEMQGVSEFTEHDFARLLLLVRDDETTKRAVTSLSSSLTKNQQDARISRTDLWERIAVRFNDDDFMPLESFPDPVRYVSPMQPSLVRKSGAKLSNVWRENVRVWTNVLSNYNVSGNNGEKEFIDFCHRNARDQKLSTAGIRTFLTYCVFGLEYDDPIINNFLNRYIPGGAGGSLGVNRNLHGPGGRKRRLSSSGDDMSSKRGRLERTTNAEKANEILSGINASMSDFAGSYKRKIDMQAQEFSERRQSTDAGIHASGSSRFAIKNTVEGATSFLKMLQMSDEAFKVYQSAIKRGDDPSHVEYLRKSYEALKQWTLGVSNDVQHPNQDE